MKRKLNVETSRRHSSTSLPLLKTTRPPASNPIATRFRRRIGRAPLPLLALLGLALTVPVRAGQPPQPPPIPITLDATGVGESVATLNGTLDPNGGFVLAAWFEWSGGTNIGDLTYSGGVVSAEVGSAGAPLACGTTYSFSFWEFSMNGEGWGGIKTFTTLLAPLEHQFILTTNNGAITIKKYLGPGGAVTIPDTLNGLPVTTIGGWYNSRSEWLGAFAFDLYGGSPNCQYINSVTIPDSVTSIGDSAFRFCSGLTNVTMGTNVASIGDCAFSQSSLTSVTIPDSVTHFGVQAFGSCGGLTSVTIPNSLTRIESGLFSGCGDLTSVTIPNTVTSIGDSAFSGCWSLINVTIPDGVSSIGDSAFDSCVGLTNVTIPNGVTSIENSLFVGCTSLTSVTLPNSITSIGFYAFQYCASLASITIPNSVTSIGYNAFSGCTSLTNATIGNSVTNIVDYAFAGCTNLTGVFFLGDAPSLGTNIFAYWIQGWPGPIQVWDPATVYYLPWTTGWGTTFGGRPMAVWQSPPPSAWTLSASTITPTGATLNGTVNPNGHSTTAWFQWGATTAYGNVTSMTDLGSGTNALPLSAPLVGLTLGVTYHFCVAASNDYGLVYGSDQSFTAGSLPFTDADWVSLNPGLPGASDTVYAIAVDGTGNVYVGGDFTVIGAVAANHIAKWDGSKWSALGPGTSGEVRALVVSGTNLYAGGSFTKAGGVTANSIARWNGSAWSALGSGMNLSGYDFGFVHSLAVSGTNLYAGGYFTTAGGVLANNIAKWDGRVWSALGSGISGGSHSQVYALAASGTSLYAGGEFTTAGGVPAEAIAKWDGSAWSGLGLYVGITATVSALAVSGTDLYVGGGFTTAGGVSAAEITKWDGKTWSALGSGVGGGGSALAVSGTDLYAGGFFTTAAGGPANYIAKWNGGAWSAVGIPGISDSPGGGVSALGVSGTNLYAGGAFTTAGGVPADHIAKWDGSAWSALSSGRVGMENTVAALAVSGSDVYAGGYFWTVGGSLANGIAKWDGSAWSAVGTGLNDYGYVNALAVSGTDLYAGGSFSSAGGVAANNIAKWDGSAWSALGSGMGNGVRALAVSGTNLYAGGDSGIVKWDGSAWSALGSGVDGSVYALAVSGTKLYAGGSFTTAGGVSANCIARWDGDTWSACGLGMSSGSGPYDHALVYALAVSGADLYAGGSFDRAGGVLVHGIAKWDGSAWSALGLGTDGGVQALAVSGTSLYAGGFFSTAGGVAANSIAKWDGSAWSALGSGMDLDVRALATDGVGHLLVGGHFLLAGTNVSPYIAQANLVRSAPTFLILPPTQTAEAGATLHLAANATGVPPLAYQWYFNGTSLLSCTNRDLVLTSLLLSQVGTYTVVISNVYGAVTSAPVTLNVIAPVERRPVPGVKVTGEAASLLNVDSADSLSPAPNWTPLGSVSLTGMPQYCFDLTQPLPPQRYYRAWQTGAPGVRPSLDLHLVPAITLTGAIGHSVRLDYINQFGPIDAWVTLATVPLTNTSQLYFDVSASGQPQRLYRLVPSP